MRGFYWSLGPLFICSGGFGLGFFFFGPSNIHILFLFLFYLPFPALLLKETRDSYPSKGEEMHSSTLFPFLSPQVKKMLEKARNRLNLLDLTILLSGKVGGRTRILRRYD